jgi:hypothetical protein
MLPTDSTKQAARADQPHRFASNETANGRENHDHASAQRSLVAEQSLLLRCSNRQNEEANCKPNMIGLWQPRIGDERDNRQVDAGSETRNGVE